MQLYQKYLIESLLKTAMEADEIMNSHIAFSSKCTEKAGWQIDILEKPLESVNVFIFFRQMANILCMCESIYSSSEERIIEGVFIEKSTTNPEEIVLHYSLF